MGRSKPTMAERERRVNAVYTMVVLGATRYQILQHCAKEFGVKTRATDGYIRDAHNLLALESEWYRPRELGRAIARLNDLYRLAMTKSQYGQALAVQKELNSLLGLAEPPAPQTLRVIGLSERELAAIVQGLEARGLKPSDVFAALLEDASHAG